MKYRIEIDGLRAIAVLAVISNHINKDFLPSGYVGVDIFFVISGFVISGSLSKTKNLNFGEFILNFYQKRIKRLVPALILFVIVFSILISFFSPSPHSQLGTGFFALFGISNIFTFYKSIDYFAPSTLLNPFTHTWSLGVEEQFYIIFPFFYWFTGFTKRKIALKKLKLNLIFLTVLSLTLFIYYYFQNFEAAYYLMPNRFWEISLGCLTYLFFNSESKLIQNLRILPPLLLFIILLITLFLPVKLGLIATISAVLITCLLLLNINPKTTLYKILSYKYLVHIGLLSYSLYLWHWGVLSISRWTIGVYWWTIPIQIFFIIIFAEFSYIFIEQKFRKATWFPKKTTNLLIGTITIGLSSIFVYLIKNANIYLGKSISYGVPGSPPERYFIRKLEKPNQNFLIIGDSHAGALYPAFEKISYEKNLSIFLHDRLYGLDKSMFSNKEYCSDKNNCPNFNYFKPLLSQYKDKFLENDVIYISLGFPGSRKINEIQRSNLNYVVDFAKRNNLKIVIQNIVPFYRQSVHALCNPEWFRPAKFISSDCSKITRDSLKNELKDIDNFYNSFSKSNKNVYLFDAFSFFCPSKNEFCNPSLEGKYINWDNNHLSIYGARLLAGELILFLEKNQLFKNKQ